MFDTIYIEDSVKQHPRTLALLNRFPQATTIPCKRYTEIFNRKAQNFRLQKHKPAILLAEKFENFILQAPASYNIGSKHNYYFSHMLNCIYDCRYCFLQGMFRSAHYVLFVNYEDFESAIKKIIKKNNNQELHFFSGYDCDSLALEPVSNFVEYFLPLFRENQQALLELRTKSTQIRSLLATEALHNVVIAYSFTPQEIYATLEHKTPAPAQRLEAMEKLQAHGWQLGLRFDPLIYHEDYRNQYRQLFDLLFDRIHIDSLHSVSLGSFRLPKSFFKTVTKLYPDELLFASPMEETDGMVSYKESIRNEMFGFCRDELLKHIPEEKFFPCETIQD